jgi:hypothetical protein
MAHGRLGSVPSRWRARARALPLLVTMTLAVAMTGGALVLSAAPAAAAAVTGGAGASLAYTELQAESASTNGTIIGPSYTQGQLADEASGRRAVTLSGQGRYVEFTLPSAANSIVVRYSIPDSADGSAYNAKLSLYINGTKQQDLTLTNAYSWFYGGYPFTNSPGSNPHHFYDEVHALLPPMQPGAKVRLQVDSGDTASSYTIDLADFEQVPTALAQPANSLSITSYGADPTGTADSSNAFSQAISAAQAQGRTVWIPTGTFQVNQHIIVNNVTIQGAGMWYSAAAGNGVGFYGNYAPNPSTNVHLSDFAIFGNVQDRNDGAQVNGIGGALANSTVSNIWIEHTKVGAWMDGPFDGLTFSGMRIRDTTADGINFHDGITHSSVTQSDLRNLGDDGLATWSDTNADAFDSFTNNTVQLPMLANGIAIYGGHDNTVSGNRVVDAGITQGGGIHVAQRFNSTPLGATTVTNNTIIRSGDLDPNWNFGVGALWFDARDAAINAAIHVDNLVIQQSPYEAIQFVSGSNISGVTISNATITSIGTFVVQEQVGGAATFTNVTATQVYGPAGQYNCGVPFTITDGGGNSGWNTTYCGAWPTPQPPPPVGLSTTPTAIDFGSQTVGTTSSARAVTVTNNGTSSVAVSSISATGDFAQTNNCAASLAAGASCTTNVTFSPAASGSRSGTLTIATSDPNGPTNVSLSGTGTAPGPSLSATPSSLSFGTTVVSQTSPGESATVQNTGTQTASISSIAASGDFAQTNNCGTSLAVGASCTVSVTFTPAAAGGRTGSVTITSNAVNSPATISLSGQAVDSSTNVALGKTATASGSVGGFPPSNAVDGNASTYWESTNNAFPQWLQVDLGTTLALGKVVIKLPPSTAWGARTQTLSVLGSTDGTTFSTIAASAGYTFDPNTNGNSTTITFAATSARFVRLNFTANTGWPAGQASELEVYPSGSSGSSATLSVTPSSLTFASQTVGTTSAAQTVTVHNTGNAAASISSFAVSGDFAQANNCGTSLAAGASCTVNVTFAPTAAGTRAGSLTISSNATNSLATVSLTGTGASSSSANLASGKTMTASGSVGGYLPSNANDGSTSTYWESTNNAFPQWLQVDLSAPTAVAKITLTLPPLSTWAARTQTLSVLGSNDGTSFTTIAALANYTFDPATGNTVTITFSSAAVRYLRLNFTANTGWPAGQVSEFEVFGG